MRKVCLRIFTLALKSERCGVGVCNEVATAQKARVSLVQDNPGEEEENHAWPLTDVKKFGIYPKMNGKPLKCLK